MTNDSNTETAERYRRLASRFTELIDAVPADRWSRPSPCEGWTAADVVEHVVTTQLDFLRQHEFAADDAIGDWPEVCQRMQSALDDPSRSGREFEGYFGPTTFARTIDDFYCADLVVHAWDIATATGLDDFAAIDPGEMVRVRSGLTPMEAVMRQPGLFGDAVEIPADADDQAQFLAFLGRSVSTT